MKDDKQQCWQQSLRTVETLAEKTRLEQISTFVSLFCNLHQILIIEAIRMYKK